MGRLKAILGTLGAALLVLGLVMMFLSGPAVNAQDGEQTPAPEEQSAPATGEPLDQGGYEGSRECQDCHRNTVRDHQGSAHALALQDTSRSQDPIVADFTAGEDLRTVTFPGEDTARPFTAGDVAYAIGSGVNAQAYVFEVERNQYRVLPAQWNVAEGQWEALELAAAWDDPAYDFVQSCAGCHTTGLDLERSRWNDDGVMCESCHGPGELHLETVDDAGRRPDDEELAAIRASINAGLDPQICGACHSRGAVPEGSPAFSVNFRPGGALSVEGEYVPFGPDDPVHWYATGQASMTNMQYNEWAASGHAAALANLPADAPADCLTCHAAGELTHNQALIAAHEAGDRAGIAPEPLTLATARFGVACTSCHDPHASRNSELPANLVAEPYALCTSCHSSTTITEGVHHPVTEMFEGTSFIENISGTPSAHFTADDGPDCLTCHMPQMPFDGGIRSSHSLNAVMPGAALAVEGLVDGCSQCHAEQATPEALQALIDDTQSGIRTRIEAARAAMPRTAPEWAVQALDFVEGDGSYGIHNYLYADQVLDVLEANLGLAGN